MKKIFALVLAALLIVASMSVAFAGTTTNHTITVTTNGDGVHEYSAFQIFKGNLSANGETLSNVVWGEDMTTEKVNALVNAIKADTTNLYKTGMFTDDDLTSAEKIANKLSGNVDNGAVARAFAEAVSTALGDATTTHKANTSNKVATISVVGDGY